MVNLAAEQAVSRAAAGLDVVEQLQRAHTETLQMLAVAGSLEGCSATASTSEAAGQVEHYLRSTLVRHFEDEELSLAPRLSGRHEVVDRALAGMVSEHFRFSAMSARLAGLCGLVRREPTMLHSLRFPIAAAVRELKAFVLQHQELEESIIFPAVKRLLDRSQYEAIDAEMLVRSQRASLAFH